MEKTLLRFGAVAGAFAALIGLYYLLVRTAILTMALGLVEGDGLTSTTIQLQFSNEATSDLTISEIELFFTDNSDCTGSQIGRTLFQSGDYVVPGPLEAGSQATMSATIFPNLEDEVRYALCATVEVFTGWTTVRTERLRLHELSTMWQELDGTDGPFDTIELVNTRTLARF
jgi:hypothetical protein